MDRSSNIDRERATKNIGTAIKMDATLPGNPFCERAGEYRFFVSDYMFEREFVEAVQIALRLEEAHVAVVVNLDRGDQRDMPVAFIDARSDPAAYVRITRAENYGYLSRERFACASDVGTWWIYCDNRADIAVFALRHENDAKRFESAFSLLHARQLADLVDGPKAEYPFTALIPEWSEGLVQNFRYPN